MNPVNRILLYIWGVNIFILLLLILLFQISSHQIANAESPRIVEDLGTGCQYLVLSGAMYPRLEPLTRKHLCFSADEKRVTVEEGKKITQQKKSS